jgi:hypothetical protein
LLATGAYAQERFANPGEATQALVAATKADDIRRVLTILGPDGRAIVESGDTVADKNAREKFVAAYNLKNRILNESGDNAVLGLELINCDAAVRQS